MIDSNYVTRREGKTMQKILAGSVKGAVQTAITGVLLATAASGAMAQGQVNIICSVQAEWCNLMTTVYAKTTGTKVNMTAKGSGEALAQLNAERANPKTDIWFGGTGDPHLQAAEQGLTLEYKSAQL